MQSRQGTAAAPVTPCRSETVVRVITKDLQSGVTDDILERRLNEMLDQTRNKGAVLFSVAAQHLDFLLKNFGEQKLIIFCDRQGGREHYGSLLRLMFDQWELEIIRESDGHSEYCLHRFLFHFHRLCHYRCHHLFHCHCPLRIRSLFLRFCHSFLLHHHLHLNRSMFFLQLLLALEEQEFPAAGQRPPEEQEYSVYSRP